MTAAAAGGTPAAPGGGHEALIVFLPTGEARLERAGLSVGILSAVQGSYDRAQLLLDLTQGARIAASAYPHSTPPELQVIPAAGHAGTVSGWSQARSRARAAPQLLTPGLLAAGVPGGAGYVGFDPLDPLDGAAAADTQGRIAGFSEGSTASLPQRIAEQLADHRLVVADLPAGSSGEAILHELVDKRPKSLLLIAIERRSDSPHGELLWAGAAGLGSGAAGLGSGAARGVLTSGTTQQRGLLATVDLAPTVLEWLGQKVPAEMRGRKLESDGTLDGAALRTLSTRLQVVGGRRLTAFGVLLCAWLLVLLCSAPWARARAGALRAGALAMMWVPVAVMVPAAFAPAAWTEYLTIALCCFALGALTDLLVPWPRAMLAPAIVAPVAIAIDALGHTQLLVRSLLGPNPALGARFYGVGNELKSALAVLVLAAVAGALHPARRDARAIATFVVAGLVLALVEGSARIGAGVGGVILVCAGTAVAAVMLAPGALTRRRALIAICSPVAGLVLLTAIDLATAHGSGHFTGSILHARSAGDVRDIVVRRYKAAWDELRNHAMPAATGISLIAAALAVRSRRRLLAPVGGDPGFAAALAGGLAAGVVGALVEDSGPVLLVVASFALVCVLAYLWAPPPREGTKRARA